MSTVKDDVINKWNNYYLGKEKQNEEDSKKLGKDINKAEENQQGALSEKAYPDNAHFIYEIIQNSEDSSYLKNHKAELEFHLLADGILVLSNQDGFTEEDVNSICLLGGGDKIAKKDQFIGEKGLGFRSVFKITDTPCISSNGYKFYFDINKIYGRVNPWLLKKFPKSLPKEFTNYKYTAIFLPYSITTNKINDLENDFKSKIKPKLILFLKKLNSIAIIKDKQKYMFIERENIKSENFELSKLRGNNIKQEFYILRKTINVNHIQEERRKDIIKRELVLAYPKEIEKSSNNVFAFLPTEINSRLNFTIQADFILDTSRAKIDENDWNHHLFEEIKQFSIDNINLFQNHSKLKFEYLKYYLQETKSNDKFIDNLYSQMINEIRNKNLIFSDNETWQQSSNIILLEDNIKIDTKYVKLLFGANYEQVHQKFELDDFFINEFNIRKVDKKEIIEAICDYFDEYKLNDYDENDVFELTKFLSKNLSTDSRASTYEKNLFEKVKQSLPIIPKYKTNKRFYLFDSIYISSEYKPKLLIENLAKENEFDFTKYNFLSNDYLENKRLTDFIKNVIDEQEKHKNKKTIEFFVKYPNILQNYLKTNIENHYKKLFDFFIEIQEDNKERISKIPILLTQSGNFYNSIQTIYFSNDSDSSLDILDENLFELVNQEYKYKEFLEKVFKVKEADILNIILNEYLPWIKNNFQKRTDESDKKLLEYTKDIIENFDKFEKEDKDKIKQSLYFISSRQKDKYLKSSSIYLSQNLTAIIFHNNSIEKYITNKSNFDFLDEKYNSILEKLDEKKVKDFFKYFSFVQYIKEDDISKFIKFIKEDLVLEENIEALNFIAKSIDKEDRKKIDKIKAFRVYSNKKDLVEIKNILFEKINDINIEYLNEEYEKNKLGILKQYFQSPYDIKCFIDYLKQDIKFEEAIKVYKYLDSNSSFNPNKQPNKSVTITSQKLRQYFKDNELIYNEKCKKFYPTDVTWREEKSSNQTFALSTIYPKELENFFIKKIQVSQSKDIRQIVNKIKDIKEKSDDYFDLLIDLNGLIDDNSELDKYYDSYRNLSINKTASELKKFIVENDKIFILDNDKRNTNGDFYFNDLNMTDYDESLKKKIFSVNDKYPDNHYSALIDSLNIKRLSGVEKSYKNGLFKDYYNIKSYREMLEFAYDLLFTKFPEQYKSLESRESGLKELNLVNRINIHQNIVSQINIDDTKIKLDSVTSYFENDELNIIDENDLFKIIAEKIGFISDKDIKDFFNEVISNNIDNKGQYYSEEKIKKKQNFLLEISNVIKDDSQENGEYSYKNNDKSDFCEDYNSSHETIENDIDEEKEISAEEERKKRQKSGAKQVKDYDKNISNNQNETSPSNLKDTQEYTNKYIRQRVEKLQKISKNSCKLSKRTKEKSSNPTTINYRVGEEETKDFFRRKEQYLGQCQICGFTFTSKNSVNYCERFTWSDYPRIKVKADLIDAGNSLCLCAKCHSIIKGGGDFESSFLTDEVMKKLKEEGYEFDTFLDDIDSDKLLNIPECFNKHIDFNDMYFVDIRLNNNEERIYFTEEHLVMFFEFLKS